MTDRPGVLAGASVVITRPRTGSDRLSRALCAAGASVVPVRVVEVVGTPDAGSALFEAADQLGAGRFAWVVLTSSNAVDRLAAALGGARTLGGTRVACVGRATAAAASSHGIPVSLVPEREDAQGLLDAFPAPELPGSQVLYPCAADARPLLADGLAHKGYRVQEIAIYRTVAAVPPPETVLGSIAGSHAVVFASPSAVRAYTHMRLGAARAPLPLPPVVACIGPLTARAARELGVDVTVVASDPSPDALVRALAGVLEGVLEGARSGAATGALDGVLEGISGDA